jgi:hypothetical protein
MLARINRLRNWQVACIIALVGLAVFFTGLTNPFEGDDFPQIVDNIPIHSIKNIRLFFEGGTFYAGQGLNPLSGHYYRPLMTTSFSLVYSLFGAHPLYFHLFQLLVCVGSSIVLYFVFRYRFNTVLSLFLALIFLVHPINSQVVYAIPNLQDGLFFLFGILSLYILLRCNSLRATIVSVLCLFLSLLAKETAVLFIAMELLYLGWSNRKRLYEFVGCLALPVAFYLLLRINAIGLLSWQRTSPINSIDLAQRLLTAPSIMLFYMSKLIFPLKLASTYQWVDRGLTVRHVLLPLLVDLLAAAVVIVMAFLIRKKGSKTDFATFVFFAIWAAIGIVMVLQVFPLDMTASEAWFYFPFAGMLGMIGVVLVVFEAHISPHWFLISVVLLLGIFGIRSALRGFDWDSSYRLARDDIVASPADFIAYNGLARYYDGRQNFMLGNMYAQRSVDIYPSYFNNNELGVSLVGLHEYPQAIVVYNAGLKHGIYIYSEENLAALYLFYGSESNDLSFYTHALKIFPKNSKICMYLAIWFDEHGDNVDAKMAITNAANDGAVPELLVTSIINNQKLTISIPNLGKEVTI